MLLKSKSTGSLRGSVEGLRGNPDFLMQRLAECITGICMQTGWSGCLYTIHGKSVDRGAKL